MAKHKVRFSQKYWCCRCYEFIHFYNIDKDTEIKCSCCGSKDMEYIPVGGLNFSVSGTGESKCVKSMA
jgi:hypothetical protein